MVGNDKGMPEPKEHTISITRNEGRAIPLADMNVQEDEMKSSSQTIILLTVGVVTSSILGILICVYAASEYLVMYTTSAIFTVSMFRLWIQIKLQATLEHDSPRFKDLPPLLKRHDASLLCRVIVFAFLLPPSIYGPVVAIAEGPANVFIKIGPAFRLVCLIIGVLSILDLSQRKGFDWRLHAHHGLVLTISAVVGDVMGRHNEELVVLIFFGILQTMDEPVWIRWPLDHLRRQREKEPVKHDEQELFPPVWMYEPEMLRKLNLIGLVHYTVIARGGTLILGFAYSTKYASQAPLWCSIVAILAYGFFMVIDMEIAAVLYKNSRN